MKAPLVPEPSSLETTVMSFEESKSEPAEAETEASACDDEDVEESPLDEQPAKLATAIAAITIEVIIFFIFIT